MAGPDKTPGKFQPMKFDADRVLKTEADLVGSVKPYEFGRLDRPGEGDYSVSKSKFGALAATDADRPVASRKDERFVMNPILRERLAVDQEEKRAIEERIAAELERRSEEARAAAYAEGLELGRQEGHEAAFAEFRAEASERITGLERLVSELEGARAEIFKANERYMMDLVFRISKMVLLKDLSVDREYVLRLARSLIERSGVRDGVRIRISMQERETIGMLKQELEASFADLRNLQIEASPQIDGGCRVETRWNAIDATLATQLDGLMTAMLGPVPEEASGTPDTGAPAAGTPSDGENQS